MNNGNGAFVKNERLKNFYLNEISSHQLQREQERIEKIKNEQEYNAYLRKLIAEEQEKNMRIKQHQVENEKQYLNEFNLRKKVILS